MTQIHIKPIFSLCCCIAVTKLRRQIVCVVCSTPLSEVANSKDESFRRERSQLMRCFSKSRGKTQSKKIGNNNGVKMRMFFNKSSRK